MVRVAELLLILIDLLIRSTLIQGRTNELLKSLTLFSDFLLDFICLRRDSDPIY